MPQKFVRFKLDGYEKEIELRELTVNQILSLTQIGDDGITTFDTFKTFASETFLPMVSNLTVDEIMGMYPSDLEVILEKFRKINSSFFALAEAAGLTDLITSLKDALRLDFSRLLVTSLRQDTPPV